MVALFVLWKLIDLVTAFLAPQFVPYLGFFSYGKDMLIYGLPDFFRSLTNFDGIFYIRIALHGYSYTEQAFFPLYPLLIRYVNDVLHNPIISGVLISYIAFIVGLINFSRYLHEVHLDTYRKWVSLFLISYPTSYYFGTMYTESTFFALFVSTLYFAKKKRIFLACMCAYFAALTRFVGVFAVIPLSLLFISRILNTKTRSISQMMKQYWKYMLLAISPLLGLATYSLYLYKTTGDALFFFHVQERFGANRSTHLILPFQVLFRYMKIFFVADWSFQYFVAIVEFSFYLFAIVILLYDLRKILQHKKYNLDRLGLNLFSFINVIIPSLTGTLTAIPRYTLLSLSIFFVLAEIKNTACKYVLLLLFSIMHIVLFTFFIQGYYVT